jgi:hypothetical protein
MMTMMATVMATARSTTPPRETQRLTLGLAELSLLNTSLDGLVELRVESGLRHDGDLVVVLDIFLDGLTAINTLAY